MIPLTARGREDDLLGSLAFDGDAGQIAKLEAQVAEYHGTSDAVVFNTPEAALLAALHLSGTVAGRAVVMSAMAPLHHYTAASLAGADPLYADIGLDGTLLPQALRAILPPESTALLNLHFSGLTPDHDAIRTALPKEGVTVIDDACSSLKPRLGGDLSLWSLKQMMPQAVEPTGFILTRRAEDAAALRLFRSQGRIERAFWNYDLRSAGSDAALSPLAASVALHRLEHLESAVDARREHAAYLTDRFGASSLLDLPPHGDTPLSDYPLRLAPALYCPKEELFGAILEEGIEVGVCCKPVYKTQRYARPSFRLHGAEELYKALFQLPCHHRLETGEREKVAETILKHVDAYGYRGCSF